MGTAVLIIDANLLDALRLLTLAERQAVFAHVRQGSVTAESLEALRRLKSRLKRRARSRAPAKAKWLM
jgi:hypothetical protein